MIRNIYDFLKRKAEKKHIDSIVELADTLRGYDRREVLEIAELVLLDMEAESYVVPAPRCRLKTVRR